MTKRLILIRHAKSAWDNPLQDDFDRPLNPRGKRDAPTLGRWLGKHRLAPDVIVVSGAKRTVETATGLMVALPQTAEIKFDRQLYLANADTILKVVRGCNSETVALIGHNPGIAQFAASITSSPPDHKRFRDYPTGATTLLSFPGLDTWAALDWGMGQADDFIVPRDLKD